MPASSATKGKTIGSDWPRAACGPRARGKRRLGGHVLQEPHPLRKRIRPRWQRTGAGCGLPHLNRHRLHHVGNSSGHGAAHMDGASPLPHFFLALAIGTAVTTVFMPMGTPAGSELQQIILVLTGVLSGFFSGMFLIYFGFAVSQLTLRGKVVCAAASTIFSSVLFVVFNVLNPELAIPFAALMPLASAALTTAGMAHATLEAKLPPHRPMPPALPMHSTK